MNRIVQHRYQRHVVTGLFFIMAVIAALCPRTARADRRSYVWSYEYQTKSPGEVELEHYLTANTPDATWPGGTSWEQRIELEIGLISHWDFALYQIFSQPPDGGFHYDAFQLRTRIRLGEAGQWPVDPLVYLEYRRSSNLTDPNKFEGKLVLARDWDHVNLVANLVEELAFAPGSEWETGYSAGISYEPRPMIKLAAEVFGDLATDGPKAHYLGPTVSLAKDKWYYTVGVGFGLNHASSDVTARAILGVDL